jgi:glycosyltransferase involved in cell wall biosynthesis
MNPFLPKIACVCPTYKRPRLLQNAVACFVDQTYYADRTHLFISDDSGSVLPSEWSEYAEERVTLISNERRFPNLVEKYNDLFRMALVWGADIVAIWEDDDIYFPEHLSAIALQWKLAEPGRPLLIAPNWVRSDYAQPFGLSIVEKASQRFHGSWAYSRRLLELTGGYPAPDAESLAFDQRFYAAARDAGRLLSHSSAAGPTYCYGWNRLGYWNGSQAGEDRWMEFYKALAQNQVEPLPLEPVYDEQSMEILNRYYYHHRQ